MIIDGFTHQLPDTDPAETQEWLDSLDAVVGAHGKVRARSAETPVVVHVHGHERRDVEFLAEAIPHHVGIGDAYTVGEHVRMADRQRRGHMGDPGLHGDVS